MSYRVPILAAGTFFAVAVAGAAFAQTSSSGNDNNMGHSATSSDSNMNHDSMNHDTMGHDNMAHGGDSGSMGHDNKLNSQ